jgi:hypothetical protein
MTYKDFSWWLEGYLTGKEKLDKGEIASILVMLRDVVEEPKINHIPPYPPTYVPDMPKPPFNPTCDVKKDPNAIYGKGTFPLEKNAKWRGEY